MINAKKTDRKNMTNQVVTWPSSDTHFTVESLLEKNSHIKQITLRVKLNKSINNSSVVRLGTLHGGKGRPKVAYTMSPVSEKALASALSNEVLLDERYSTVNVNVMNISSENNVESANTKVEKNSSHTVNA